MKKHKEKRLRIKIKKEVHDWAIFFWACVLAILGSFLVWGNFKVLANLEYSVVLAVDILVGMMMLFISVALFFRFIIDTNEIEQEHEVTILNEKNM